MERSVEKEGILAGIFLELNLEAQMALAFYLHFWKLLSSYQNPGRVGFLPFLHGLLPWCGTPLCIELKMFYTEFQHSIWLIAVYVLCFLG